MIQVYSQKVITRGALLRIIRNSFPTANRIQIALRLERLIDEAHELKKAEGKAYNAKGQLVPQLTLGKRWEDQKRQRRLKTVAHPKAKRGRPKLMWPRYLIASLGREYIRQTGNPPTFGVWNTLSPFEHFVQPILFAFAVFDTRHLVKEYLREMAKKNPWPPGQV